MLQPPDIIVLRLLQSRVVIRGPGVEGAGRHAVDHVRLKGGKPDIGEREIDRPQLQPDIAAPSVKGIGFPVRRHGQRQHRPFPDEPAVLDLLLAGIDVAIDEHPVEPSLQDGRRHMPPHRILQDHQVRLIQQIDFILHFRRQRFILRGMALFRLGIETPGIGHIPVMRRPLAGVEAQCIEIAGGDLPPPAQQGVPRQRRQMRVEGFRLRMGEDDMGFHGSDLVFKWRRRRPDRGDRML